MEQAEAPQPGVLPTPWRALYVDALKALSPGVFPGMLCGAIIGGVGGRLAMLLLRLTSSDSLHGMQTDDEFTIGAITGDSLFLLIATAILGLLGGVIYLLVREWLPEKWRSLLFALLGGAFGGAVVIRPGGTDFTVLEPLSLAVALFVLLPAVYAATLSIFTERLIRSPGFRRSRLAWAGVALLLLAVLAGGPFGLAAVLIFAIAVPLNRSGDISRIWHSTPALWLGRLAFTAALVASSLSLARDVALVL